MQAVAVGAGRVREYQPSLGSPFAFPLFHELGHGLRVLMRRMTLLAERVHLRAPEQHIRLGRAFLVVHMLVRDPMALRACNAFLQMG